jgi:diguanylate cyclase (GGDEF)-like protein/PAS domain S-box-containing protein
VAPRRRDVAVVTARDVTQEVEARAQADAEEARYRSLVESSPQPIAIIQDERFVYANQAVASLLRVDDASQVIGQALDRFTAVQPEVDRRRSDALERGMVMEAFEAPITRLDGSQAVVELTHIPTTWKGHPAVQVVAVDLTDRRRTESLLAHSALHDPVSGLPNRSLLADRVEQAIRRARRTGERSALLFCDIDHFKVVNDALGHDAGDRILVEVARRLRAVVRETDTVARFGGDEMVILSHDLNEDDDVDRLVERIRHAFTDPFDVDGRPVHLTVSSGVAHIHGAEQRDELMSLAEGAMFAAKDAGRNRSVVADEHLLARTGDRLRIQTELHASLASDNGLSLHLQPELDLASGRTIGFEALIRFSMSDNTSVAPDRFLPIAAEAGLMHRIGGFVIGETARALARLPAPVADAWIAVNASAEELEHPEFASQIVRALDESGLRGEQLCIEITEHSIMRDPSGMAATLKPLRDRGVAIAIDDFGTGYSSLAYLARFQPEYLKIDRSFTADIANQPTQLAIVEGILHLADSLGLITVAEGIETAEQAELLRELGCQLGQGWFFGRPAPVGDALARGT